MGVTELQILFCRRVINGHQDDARRLPGLAADLLAAGWSGEYLAELASTTAADDAEAKWTLLAQALADFGLPVAATEPEAHQGLAAAYAVDLLAGRRSIDDTVRAVCGEWEFDEVILHSIDPPLANDFARAAWARTFDDQSEYEGFGGDDGLLARAKALAESHPGLK